MIAANSAIYTIQDATLQSKLILLGIIVVVVAVIFLILKRK